MSYAYIIYKSVAPGGGASYNYLIGASVVQDDLRQKGKKGFTGANPIPTECEHVLRGGAFNYGAAGLRSSNRVHHPGRFRLIMSGVRCAKDAG